MLPADLAPSPEILFELLELAEDVAVVRLIDQLRQERRAHAEELVGQWRRVLYERGPEALEHVGVRFERQAEELLELPVALLAARVLELFRNAIERPVEIGGRQIDPASVRVR